MWFTVWQALASTVLTLAVAASRRVRARPLPLPRPRRSSARSSSCRSCCRRSSSRSRSSRSCPTARARVGADPRRARVLQRRRRRPDRRDVLGEPRPADRRGRRDARRVPLAARAREITLPLLAPALAAAAAIVFLFSLHVVRHRPHPRRAALRDGRGRDLQPGRPAVRPARRRRALARAARVRRRRRLGRDAARAATSRGTARSRRERDAAPAADGRRAGSSSSASLGGLGALPRRSRSPCSSSARSPSAAGTASTPTGRSADATSVLLVAPWEAVVNSLVYAAAATRDRGRRRRARRVRGRAAARPRAARRARPAPARRVGGDARVRLPHRFRHRPARLPRRAVDRPGRAGARRDRRSSSGSSRRRCARSTRGSGRRGRSSAPRPAGSGARSTCRSSRAALAVAAGFAFAISLGEFGATVFLARPDRPTLPVAIFRFLGRPGALNVGQAFALAVVLMAVTVVCGAPRRADRACGGAAGSDAPRRGRRASRFDGARSRSTASTLDVARRARRVAVLGPSGFGEDHAAARRSPGCSAPDAGAVLLDGVDLAGARRTGAASASMFQDHALFPHRDVAGNVAFGLRMRGAPGRAGRSAGRRAARARRPRGLRAPLGRDALGRRAAARRARPRARAGAPRAPARRAARLARPTAPRPPARRSRARSSTRSSVTAVYVTHDQTEAFALGDRVAVMRAGRVVQVATPDELWARPRTPDVARFLGLANVAAGEIVRPEAVTVRPARARGTADGRARRAAGPVVRLRVRLDDGRGSRRSIAALDHPRAGRSRRRRDRPGGHRSALR